MSELELSGNVLDAIQAGVDKYMKPLADMAELKLRETLSSKEVEKLFGIPAETLRFWRNNGTGPTFLKLERRVLYRRADLEEWLNAGTIHRAR